MWFLSSSINIMWSPDWMRCTNIKQIENIVCSQAWASIEEKDDTERFVHAMTLQTNINTESWWIISVLYVKGTKSICSCHIVSTKLLMHIENKTSRIRFQRLAHSDVDGFHKNVSGVSVCAQQKKHVRRRLSFKHFNRFPSTLKVSVDTWNMICSTFVQNFSHFPLVCIGHSGHHRLCGRDVHKHAFVCVRTGLRSQTQILKTSTLRARIKGQRVHVAVSCYWRIHVCHSVSIVCVTTWVMAVCWIDTGQLAWCQTAHVFVFCISHS